MAAEWNQIESRIKAPSNKDDFRDHVKSVFDDRRKHLYLFGVKGIDPTNDNWHETSMIGSYMSCYDVSAKRWLSECVDLPALDTDPNRRDHLFVVNDHIMFFVYAAKGCCYHKLFELENGKFGPEIKIEATCPAEKPAESTGRINYLFFTTPDGFYAIREGSPTCISKFTVQFDATNAKITGAKCVHVAKLDLKKFYRMGGHVTMFAHSDDHKRLFVWGGEQKCGFWWDPQNVLTGDLSGSSPIEVDKKVKIEGACPPYSFGGPYRFVQEGPWLVMIGGSTAKGMSHVEDNPEMWAFDTKEIVYKKLDIKLPVEISSNRLSHAYDFKNGVLYLIDTMKGIYQINLIANL